MTHAALRRALHALTAVLAALPWAVGWPVCRALMSALAVGAVVFEGLRIGVPQFAQYVSRWVPVYRPLEARRASGAFWLATGYTVAAWLPTMTPLAFAAGVAVAALADPAASLAGTRVSRAPGKSWRGTLGASVVGFAALLLLGLSYRDAAVAALVGAAAERWSGPVDDNLVVAPCVALAVLLLA